MMFLTAILVAVSLYGPTAPCHIAASPGVPQAQCAVIVHTADLPDDVPYNDPATGQVRTASIIGLATGDHYGNPVVLIDSVYHGEQRTWRWGYLCSLMLHEFGHQHGLNHSLDPMNVMYPNLHRTDNYCRGKRPEPYRPWSLVKLGPAAKVAVPLDSTQ